MSAIVPTLKIWIFSISRVTIHNLVLVSSPLRCACISCRKLYLCQSSYPLSTRQENANSLLGSVSM